MHQEERGKQKKRIIYSIKMVSNTRQIWANKKCVEKMDTLTKSCQSKIPRTASLEALMGVTPTIEKTEIKRLPKSKKRRLVVFGRWEFEIP